MDTSNKKAAGALRTIDGPLQRPDRDFIPECVWVNLDGEKNEEMLNQVLRLNSGGCSSLRSVSPDRVDAVSEVKSGHALSEQLVESSDLNWKKKKSGGIKIICQSAMRDFSAMAFITDHVNALIEQWFPGPPQDPHRASTIPVVDLSRDAVTRTLWWWCVSVCCSGVSESDTSVSSVGNVLWAESCGQRPVWQRPVGSVLWAASCGQRPVGQRPVVQRPVGSVLWAVSCRKRPVGSVLWGSVLWAVSPGQRPVSTNEGLEDDQHCTVQQQMSYRL
ncbi:hypothetical protein NFI96_008637 [Prochilodus magdalenae]|nr:hypothetical protein NFI96_008637 [Prochilodus magdalenae]